MTPAEILALARQAQEGKREAAESLRVAVAEARGYRQRARVVGYLLSAEPRLDWVDPDGNTPVDLPDWPNDIAAAFGLGEEATKRGIEREYGYYLAWVLEKVIENAVGCFEIAHLHPAMRCAALLLAFQDAGIACGEGEKG